MAKFRLWLRESWIGAMASVAILVMLSAGPAWAQASKWITTTGVAYVRSVASIPFTNGTKLADTAGSGKLLLTGTTPMIQFGGTTSSQPAIKSSGTLIDFRLADDSAETAIAASSATFNGNGIAMGGSGGAFFLAGASSKLIINTAPSSLSACGAGTAPTFVWSNGAAAFEILTGSSTPVATCTWTMPAASNRWVCDITDITTQNASVFVQKMSASSTTSVTMTNYNTAGAATAVVASDHLLVKCLGG